MHVWTAVVPRRFLRRFLLRPVAKWLVPAWRCIAFPVADRRKRFFVDLCVFIFGLDFCFLAIGRHLLRWKQQ